MRLLDPFFAIRPLVLVPAWSFFLLGAAASPSGGELPGLRLAAFTLAMIGVHLVNQIVDLESHRINDKCYFLQRRIFTPQQYGVAVASCLVLSVGTAAATGQAPLRLAVLKSWPRIENGRTPLTSIMKLSVCAGAPPPANPPLSSR